MTEKEQIESWLKEGRLIETEAERNLFLKGIHEKLEAKNGDELAENLLALKLVVNEFHKKVKEVVRK